MTELQIELISVGDEILLGHTLDTNSHWIANQLANSGYRLRWHSTIGDNESDMRHQFRRAWNRADVVIITGGLGPTHDDKTRPVLAQFFEDELVTRLDLAKRIEDKFAARGLKVPFDSQKMAEFPSRAEPILNKEGSAPGIHYCEDNRDLFSLPGVPVEMQEMVTNYILPKLNEIQKGVFHYHIFRTAGIFESGLNELIGSPELLKPVELAYLPSIDKGVTLRLSVSGEDEEKTKSILAERADQVRNLISDFIFTESEDSLAEVILEKMRKHNLKLAVAESCTGGLLSNNFVCVPGSSDVFERGFTTYSNESKIELLGVEASTIEKHGAVSGQVAAAMAEGALECAGVDIAVSVTGIAGPTGGTEEKPVGHIFFGIADKKGTYTESHRFDGNRTTNRRRSVLTALTLLWRRLKEQ